MSMKSLAYRMLFRYVLPACYRRAAKKTVEKRALFLEVRYPEITDDLKTLRENYRRDPEWETEDFFLRAGEGGSLAYLRRCLMLAKRAAGAKLIFLDESTNVLSALPIREETKVIQTWHACGAFKRWGCALPEGGEAAKDYYGRYDLVTVSAPEVADKYAESMNQDPSVVRPLGVSRTDRFFDEAFLQQAESSVRKKIPEIRDRKIILYAPTFRGNVANAQSPVLPDAAALARKFGETCVILFQPHPAVKETPEIPEAAKKFFIPVARRASTEELMCAADVCITDYSSLIFEYSLMDRPMLFYAYDEEEYTRDRGFYYDYRSFVPGPICKDTDELADALGDALGAPGDLPKVRAFREKFMSACDGAATRRIRTYIDRELLSH